MGVLKGMGAGLGLALWGTAGLAQDNLSAVSFEVQGETHVISQAKLPDAARLTTHFQSARGCDGLCLAPLRISERIETLAEAEVIRFVTEQVARGGGLLVDSRPVEARATGHIAGSVSIPLALLDAGNPYRTELLLALGAIRGADGLDFAGALPLVVYDDGPTSRVARDWIDALRATGYPEPQIGYYRGGLLVWTALGLSVETP